MARLYNTRVLLDPTMIQNVSNVADRRLQNEMELNKRMGDSIRSVLSKGGETLDEYRARKQREEQINEWDVAPEVYKDPAFQAYKERYINEGDANGLGNYLNSIANRKLQENTMKWHSDVQDRERISTWERGRQQAENRLSYINAVLEKDPNNQSLLLDKQNTLTEIKYYRDKLGMPVLQEKGNENKPQPQTPQENPQTETPQVNENKNLGLSNEEFSKIFNEKLNSTVWRDKDRDELKEFVENNVIDSAKKLQYMTQIDNKGVTEEDADRWIEENQKKASLIVIPPEYKDKVEKKTIYNKQVFKGGKFTPPSTTIKLIRKK